MPAVHVFQAPSMRDKKNHSPQGVETGDLRSSRHIPQVNSDMLTANVVPHCQQMTERFTDAACGRFSARSWCGSIEGMSETRRGASHVYQMSRSGSLSPLRKSRSGIPTTFIRVKINDYNHGEGECRCGMGGKRRP